MTAIVSHMQVESPTSIGEALQFLHDHPEENWRPIAGGTDVMVQIGFGKTSHDKWLDIARLRGDLSGIIESGDRIRVGAMTTMTEVRKSSILADTCPLIGEAAATVGAIQIQNRATVGGNIANGSPAGDTLPVWLAMAADIELTSVNGSREVPYSEFMTGYRTNVMKPNELLTGVIFRPIPSGTRILYRKIGTRAAQAISKAVLCGIAPMADGNYHDVRLAFGSVAATPVRAPNAEQAANGKGPSVETGMAAAKEIAVDLTPIDDVRSTADYRSRVCANLVRAFLSGNLGKIHS